MRITLNDVRTLFTPITRFRLTCVWYDDVNRKHTDTVCLDNMFWGISAFLSVEILKHSIKVINDDCVQVETDMPIEVFRVMKEHLEKYQND